MLHAGLDLSRKRLAFHLLDEAGESVDVGAAPPDGDGLRSLAARLSRHRQPVRAAIESMTGARFVHDRLELHGWQVEIAGAQKVKGAGAACLQDRPHRRLGAGRAGAPRAGAGDLAARPAGAGRARARPLAPAPEPLLCTVPGIGWVLADTIAAEIGRQRGAKVAQIDLARRLTEAIWHMLTREQPFAPKAATDPLAA
jgi:hypothetical protein